MFQGNLEITLHLLMPLLMVLSQELAPLLEVLLHNLEWDKLYQILVHPPMDSPPHLQDLL